MRKTQVKDRSAEVEPNLDDPDTGSKRALCLVTPLAIALSLAVATAAAAGDTHRRIVPPPTPLDAVCFTTETQTHSGALHIEEIEGEVIDGFGYGNVTAESGESWGYWLTVSGQLDGAILTLTTTTIVEGDEIEEDAQWAFVNGGIITDMGTYLANECMPIIEEFTRRLTQRGLDP